MKLVFWQNIISPHQVDLLEELAKSFKVVLIVDREIDRQRGKQNWSTNTPENIDVKVGLNFIETVSFIQREIEAIHIVSGLFAYKTPSLVLLIATFLKIKVYIISEAIEFTSLKGKVKLLIRKIINYPIKNRIFGVFVTGKHSKSYFKKLGFRQEQLADFGYFVNAPECPLLSRSVLQKKLIYVGRLVKYKGVMEVLASFAVLNQNKLEYSLDIIGSGPLESNLKQYAKIKNLKNLNFINDIPREDVLHRIANADLLLLPNISWEGWGAVINEALLLGTPVICSRYTGAHVIVKENVQGIVLDTITETSIIKAVIKMAPYDREEVKRLALKSLSPNVAADYFKRVLIGRGETQSIWLK